VGPEDTEIVVDGKRIGLARDFHGPVVVPVISGPHLVEFHWRGFSVTTHIMASPRTTVIIRRNVAAGAIAEPPSQGGSGRLPY
jgi:hypothetical protein